MGDQDRLDSLLTRRAFVELVGKGALAVALGGFIRFLGRKDIFPRPPGALPEEEFLALCIRCGKCRKACPEGIIAPVLLTESIVSVGTPRLALGYCLGPHCLSCNWVCPTGALGGVR